MAKRADNYSKHQYNNNYIDIDVEQLMEMVETGYSVKEIAKELSVSIEHINMLRDDTNKYY